MTDAVLHRAVFSSLHVSKQKDKENQNITQLS